ncbi:MAG TPA: TIGR02281 family clan AA aspartic protease [Candidatus Binatus sp.]|nr:TIGR02281 family clan AA aspartic protease [Candidatus Binatus sp.]
MKTALIYLLASLSVGLLLGRLTAAEYYRWVDDSGVLHITDNLHNVPPKHREGANRIEAKESPRQSEPEAKVAAPAPRKASIPFERNGNIVVVPVTLNNRQTVKLVVDTGASYTFISQALARDLNIDLSRNQKTFPFHTANGVVEAPLTTLDSITVGGMEIKNLTAAVHDATPDIHAAGLLGLNFLSNFRMDIDTERGLLNLEKK